MTLKSLTLMEKGSHSEDLVARESRFWSFVAAGYYGVVLL